MFEHSGVAKRSVAGLLPSSISTSNQRPAALLASSQLMAMAGSNHRVQTGRASLCALSEDAPGNNKRTSGHLGRHTRHLKRLKVAESEVKKIGSGGVRGGKGGLGIGRERRVGGKVCVNSDGGDRGDKSAGDECGVALNVSKDQNKLLMSDSSENSEVEWNDDSDEDHDLGQTYTTPSSSHPHHQQDRGRIELAKSSSRQDTSSKRKPEEDVDVDGGDGGRVVWGKSCVRSYDVLVVCVCIMQQRRRRSWS